MSEERKKYTVQITRRGLVVWSGLFFFIMGWMFVLGILVGRDAVPLPARSQNVEKELGELKTTLLNKNKADVETKGRAKEGELGFYEALKKSPSREIYKIGPPSPAVKKVSENAGAAPAREAAAAAAQAAPPPPPEPAEKPVQPAVKPPEPAKDEERRATPAPPAEKNEEKTAAMKDASPAAQPAGRFTIQVAAYKDLQSAEQLVTELRAKGYPCYALRAEIQGQGAWFRVRVGAFQDRAAAEGMLKRLTADRLKGMVVGAQ